MTRKSIEDELYILKRDRETIIAGNGKFNLVASYALGEGTGLHAFTKAKEAIDSRIAVLERELDKIPVLSALENAKRTYEYCGATNASTKDYIAALEKCRPWVIRSKSTGKLATRMFSGDIALFSTKEMADRDRAESGRTSEWESVQWEGKG